MASGRVLSILWTLIFVCYLLASGPVSPVDGRGVNGGTNCAGCSIILSLVDQLAEIHNETAVQVLTNVCGILPGEFKKACHDFLEIATPVLLDFILEKYNADVACHALNLCYTDPGQPECGLYPSQNKKQGGIRDILKGLYLSKSVSKETKMIMMGKRPTLKSSICDTLPGLSQLCKWLEGHIDNHTAAVDFDKDGFGVTETLRGSHWRGKDCDDIDKTIYPGRRSKNNDIKSDSDCNGIFGINPTTGHSFEEDYCQDFDHRGVIALGDSATAHFHIPGEWMTASKLSQEIFKDVLMVVEDEFDWPELSATTGYMNSTWDIIHGPTESLYHQLFERNKCNHRDFQNIGVNGARVSSMNESIQYSMSRDPQMDHPAIVVYSLIGNDVCNGDNDTIAHMTVPEDMKKYSLSTLKYLDTRLPNGSFVLVSGMADGRFLYELMSQRIHPLGEFNQDITYTDIYEYMSCLQVSPCNGWMTVNATLRNFTSERAANLSKALEEVVKENTFKNFKAYYYEFDFKAVLKMWEEMGGEGWQLIEPIDGFHPNQNYNYMFSKFLWNEIATKYPEVLGKVNPHNEDIKKQFGDQGGY